MAQGQEYLAYQFAVLRWYANAIDNLATQIYFCNVDLQRKLEGILKGTLDSLHELSVAGGAKPQPCPPGTERCWDGSCAPECPPPTAGPNG